MKNLLVMLIGVVLGRLPRAVAACAPASCSAARQLRMRPRPSNETAVFVPMLGWIVVEHVPMQQRGPPGAHARCASGGWKPQDHGSSMLRANWLWGLPPR